MKKLITVPILILLTAGLFAQQNDPSPQKYALVIGNEAYIDLNPLANPVNDANDIGYALRELGFSVDVVLNGTLPQMEDAVIALKEKLGGHSNAYGFFFYAGHGVQSMGENFLIPVDANIPSESYLRLRSLSVQAFLDDLNDARNSLNVVVLDACRDNPFNWNRSTTRGLATISRQPAGSLIVYATSAGMRASDGEGRNGLFTSQLLPNLLTPGLEVSEVFRRTGADVAVVSGNQQVPAIYSQYFGTAYLGEPPSGQAQAYVPGQVRPAPLPSPGQPKKNDRSPDDAAKLWSVGASLGISFADPILIGTIRGTVAPVKNLFIEAGLDLGFLSGDREAKYYLLTPYARGAYYYPIGSHGIYAEAGLGYMIGKYNFPEGDRPVNSIIVDIAIGGNIFSLIDVSYTLRTSFKNLGHKFSVGYIYRFR